MSILQFCDVFPCTLFSLYAVKVFTASCKNFFSINRTLPLVAKLLNAINNLNLTVFHTTLDVDLK